MVSGYPTSTSFPQVDSWSMDPRVLGASHEGYTWVPKTRDFAKFPNEEFGKSKVLGLGSIHKAS